MIYSVDYNGNEFHINVSSLATGVYYIDLINNNTVFSKQTFIIK
jgi:hypothetical protein